MILKHEPGIYAGVPMAEYLAAPAVSASLIGALVERCPLAAWHDSWLNPKPAAETSDAAQGAGTIAHAILLEGSTACVEVIDPTRYPAEKTGNIPDGWTNKAIRAARDEAFRRGKVPVFPATMATIEAMVSAARHFIDSLRTTEPAIYALMQPDGGDSELTILWDDDGTLCRIRPDRISKDRRLVLDYKTGGTTAEPNTWGRTQMIKMGYHTSGCFYRRGVEAATGVKPDYVFLVQEQEAPHLCSLVGIDPPGLVLGARKVQRGLTTWKSCIASGDWPGYPTRVCYPEIPPWEHAREEAAGIPYDPAVMWGDRAKRKSWEDQLADERSAAA